MELPDVRKSFKIGLVV